ncbi:hypothetical protein R3P38DRAFT_2533372, partial [Favolaschia claudopus]
GNRWCDMSMDGCHRCGGRSHKAVSCIKEMPPEVKDWCLNRAYETAQLAADSTHFAAESTHPVASYFAQEPSAPSPSSHGYSFYHAVPDAPEYGGQGRLDFTDDDFDA